MSRQHSNTAARPGRPHLLALTIGALDARYNHVDFFDTVGGEELMRWYRHRQEQHHPKLQAVETKDASSTAGARSGAS